MFIHLSGQVKPSGGGWKNPTLQVVSIMIVVVFHDPSQMHHRRVRQWASPSSCVRRSAAWHSVYTAGMHFDEVLSNLLKKGPMACTYTFKNRWVLKFKHNEGKTEMFFVEQKRCRWPEEIGKPKVAVNNSTLLLQLHLRDGSRLDDEEANSQTQRFVVVFLQRENRSSRGNSRTWGCLFGII